MPVDIKFNKMQTNVYIRKKMYEHLPQTSKSRLLMKQKN